LATSQNAPSDPRQLVGERDRKNIAVQLTQRCEPTEVNGHAARLFSCVSAEAGECSIQLPPALLAKTVPAISG
jgi:hypothetical protein